MKREFLEELGLDKQLIDTIMSEHGRSVSQLKEKCKDLEERDTVIAALTSERDGLLSSLSDESEKHAALKGKVIDEIIREARPSSLLAEKELRRALSECDGVGIREVLDKIMEDDPDAFNREKNDAPIFSAFTKTDVPTSSFKYRTVR